RDGEVDLVLSRIEILHSEMLVAGPFPEKDRAPQVQDFPRKDELLLPVDVRIAEIRHERGIVVAHRAAQEQRVVVSDEQLEPRKMPRIAMEQPGMVSLARRDVAAIVEYRKRVALLQCSRVPLRDDGFGRRNVIMRRAG